MRKLMLTAMMMVVLGVGAASAQMIDPTTGINVDPATDPVDYSAIIAGDATNIGEEVNAQAMAQQEAQNAQDFQDFVKQTNAPSDNNSASSDDSNSSDQAAVVTLPPVTPKPTLTPNGTKVVPGTQVALIDQDPAAVIFYTTDGKKPTLASARYTGPIVLNAKEKIRAIAFNPNDRPSAAVSRTFKVKS